MSGPALKEQPSAAQPARHPEQRPLYFLLVSCLPPSNSPKSAERRHVVILASETCPCPINSRLGWQRLAATLDAVLLTDPGQRAATFFPQWAVFCQGAKGAAYATASEKELFARLCQLANPLPPYAEPATEKPK